MPPLSYPWVSTVASDLSAGMQMLAARSAIALWHAAQLRPIKTMALMPRRMPTAAYASTIALPSSGKELGLTLCIALLAITVNTLVRRLKRPHRLGQTTRRVVIAGDIAHLSRWTAQHPALRQDYRLTAAIGIGAGGDQRHALQDVPLLPDLQTLQDLAACRQFDELWLALPILASEAVRDYVKAMQHYFVNVRLLVDARDVPLFNPNGATLGDYAFIDLVASPRHSAMHWLKPVFDQAFAAAALILLAPLMAALALAIKTSSPGPALFRQRRLGLDGREFIILKFRSMKAHADSGASLVQATRHDDRITPLGRFLRRTSLDELPQLINVLRGDMSLVGPRPHAVEHDDFYRGLIDGYMYRYRIRPGMTGWAQVHGLRGETAEVETMAQRIAMDLFYIQHWSFWLDLKIVAMTIATGFTDKNAY